MKLPKDHLKPARNEVRTRVWSEAYVQFHDQISYDIIHLTRTQIDDIIFHRVWMLIRVHVNPETKFSWLKIS
jgi:hypothetical protein